MTNPDPALYAVVEIMGHRTRAGALSDATIGGATLLRIEHPTAIGHDDGPLVEYYAPTAIFAIRPCSREGAEQVARYWRGPVEPPALPPAFDEFVEVDDDVYVDDEDDRADAEVF